MPDQPAPPAASVRILGQGSAGPTLGIPFPLPSPPAYFNGFGIAAGPTEITVTLMNASLQVGAIQATPSVLKELCRTLTDAIAQIEKATGVTHKPLGELLESMKDSS